MTDNVLRSVLKSTLAKLPERLKNAIATLQKVYNCPKEASKSIHSLQHLGRSRIVVVLLRVVILLLTNVPQRLRLHTTAVAAKLLYQKDLSSKVCRIGL